jgi:hypothetical protein
VFGGTGRDARRARDGVPAPAYRGRIRDSCVEGSRRRADVFSKEQVGKQTSASVSSRSRKSRVLLLAILAAASAWLVTRKAPQHRPLAWALTVCAGLDAIRLLGLPARVDVSLCLILPAVSSVAYQRVMGSRSNLAPYVVILAAMWCALALWTLPPRAQLWAAYPVICYGLLIFSGTLDAVHRAVFGGWAISQRAALILLAGDALAVASLCAREWISNQAGAALAAVTVYQMVWWWRWNVEKSD